MAYQKFETEVAGRPLTVETGRVAEQANGAVMLRSGDTVLLVTAVASKQPREGIDFFPLTCDYEEKLYAAGRIPGSFPRREGRPSEAAVMPFPNDETTPPVTNTYLTCLLTWFPPFRE